MEGSAKILSLIARDESQHLVITQNILKKWADGDDPEMKEISIEEKDNVQHMFKKTVDEEKAWANYLFKEGSMIGLNEKLLHQYVEWIANKRMKAIGLNPIYDIPAIPECTGEELTNNLIEQIKPFKFNFHLNDRVQEMKNENNKWYLRHTVNRDGTDD